MRYADAGKAYAEADHISGEVGEAGNQAFSRACLVNLDLEEGKLPVTGLLDRIEDAIQQAGKSNDAYSQSFARIIKARLLLQANKVAEAGREAQSAVDLAQEDKQATNKVSAQIILAETKARSGEVAEALAELDRLKALTDHERNVGQNLEAQLTYLKVMKQAGQLQQRKDAAILLSEFQKDAQEKGYKLLAAKAQSIMHGKP